MPLAKPPLLCGVLLMAGVALAQDRQQPLAPAKAPERKSLIVETLHPYAVREYNPLLVIATDVSKPAMAFDHPERTLAADLRR